MGVSVFAQEQTSDSIEPQDDFESEWQVSEPVNNNVNCFDYYKFQSVQVSVGAERDLYVPGEQITFSGDLMNENDYGIVDGYVFARVSQVNDNFMTEGNFIVDEFIALDNVTLNKNESKPTSFTWTIPKNAIASSYQVDFFFSVGKKFNLGG
jgi:hypothetical protein